MSDDIPHAPNLDSHSPFSSGVLPTFGGCDDDAASFVDLTELQAKLQFLLDSPVSDCVSVLEQRCCDVSSGLDVLRDVCTLISGLAIDRTHHYTQNLPTIVELLRRFIVIVQSGSTCTGKPVYSTQRSFLLADLYYLLSNSLLQLHGSTEPAEAFGWSTQGSQPDPSKLEDAGQLILIARELHGHALCSKDISQHLCHNHTQCLGCGVPVPRFTPSCKSCAVPANLVPLSRILTRAALIAKARCATTLLTY